VTRRKFDPLQSVTGTPTFDQYRRGRASRKRPFRQLTLGGRETPASKIYADFIDPVLANVSSDARDALEGLSGSAISVLLPTAAADLADCEIYTIGCWGRQRVPSAGRIFTLDAAESAIVAAWVNAGGKLLCTVDYKEWPTALPPQFGLDPSYYTDLSNLISNAGGTLTFGAEDTTGGVTAPYPVADVLSDTWTTDITTKIEYDDDAGSSINNGTQLFAPVVKNTIVRQQCGSGWVLCFGSQNTLWGNKDLFQINPTNYTAVTQILTYLWNV
jgi:hypothetical protein